MFARSETNKPREVFLAACEEIASRFADQGFFYAPSRRHMTKRQGMFTYEISFGSSSKHNMAGVMVKLWIAGLVRSNELKRWRERQPVALPRGAAVAAGNLGNLRKRHRWLEWNLAERYRFVIPRATRAIKKIALPYFGLFENSDRLVERLRRGSIPGLRPGDAVELLLMLGEEKAALEHGRAVLSTTYPVEAERYAERLRAFRQEGLPAYDPLQEGEQLAYVAFAHKLEF